VVISAINAWTCTQGCGSGDFVFTEGEGPLYMDCAQLGHLAFLQRSDAAITSRSEGQWRVSGGRPLQPNTKAL